MEGRHAAVQLDHGVVEYVAAGGTVGERRTIAKEKTNRVIYNAAVL